MDIFHPISRSASKQIEELIFEKCDEIFENDDKQHSCILQ
jgi:DNA-binding cell septation regulator SpoVG